MNDQKVFDVHEGGIWEFTFKTGEQIVLMSWVRGVSILDWQGGSQYAPTTRAFEVEFVIAPVNVRFVLFKVKA